MKSFIQFDDATDSTGRYVRATLYVHGLHEPLMSDWMRSEDAALRSLARKLEEDERYLRWALVR